MDTVKFPKITKGILGLIYHCSFILFIYTLLICIVHLYIAHYSYPFCYNTKQKDNCDFITAIVEYLIFNIQLLLYLYTSVK